jgi:hypothetical protein
VALTTCRAILVGHSVLTAAALYGADVGQDSQFGAFFEGERNVRQVDRGLRPPWTK